MSLMGTLAKVAISIAVAKGADAMLKNRNAGPGRDGLFDGRTRDEAAPGGGLEDLMSDVLGGGRDGAGGLGGLLEGLQNDNPRTGTGGLNDLLAGGGGGMLDGLMKELTGGAGGGGAAGGLGGLLGGLAGAMGGAAAGGQGTAAGFGSLLNQSMARRGEPEAAPSAEQDAAAGLMIRAMIQAAKSDGTLDDAEKDKILENLGEVTADELTFVQDEFSRPVDARALARQVPEGLEQQIYAMSILAINLDDRSEANHLHDLANALRLAPNVVNQIHGRFGAPPLYG